MHVWTSQPEVQGISAILDPEKSQECPIEFINDMILEQALQVKRHLQKRPTLKTGISHVKTPENDPFESNYSWTGEKNSINKKSR